MLETILLSETKALESHDLKRLRHHAERVFESLERQISNKINNGDDDNVDDIRRRSYFDSNGFWVARGFCNTDETLELKQAMTESVRKHWFPNNANANNANHDQSKKDGEEGVVTSFGTDSKSNEARGDPFLESADKVAYFAEPTAMDDSGTGTLKPEFMDDDNDDDDGNENENENNDHNIGSKEDNKNKNKNKKLLALCKAGHGLHLPPARHLDAKNDGDGDDNVHEPFFTYATSAKLRELVLSLGYKDPVVPQSMYIFKNPIVGGAVHSHQDSTFLYTTPKQTCLGLWLALDDATLDNGCLWVRPKSHFEPLRRQFIRNPKYNNNNDDDDDNDNDDDNKESKLVFRTHHDDPNVTWEGALPESVDVNVDVVDSDNGGDDKADNDDDVSADDVSVSSLNFVPVEVKAGDLVVFGGTLDHFSLPNFSDKQRHTFQLHLVEGPNAGVTWSPENWLQYENDNNNNNNNNKFLRLHDYEC